MACAIAGEWSLPDGDTTTPAAPTGRHGFDFHLGWKRILLLWEGDSDVPEERRGVRVFRHGSVDKAAEMAEAMMDDLDPRVRRIAKHYMHHAGKSPMTKTSSAQSTDTNGRRQRRARTVRTSRGRGGSSNAARRH